MSSHQPNLTRPHPTESPLTLDQQSLQDLLAAAFTIQEHNERRRQAQLAPLELENHLEPEASTTCPQCGAAKPAGDSHCPTCRLEELRPGERMQRNWASMWLMSQEQGLWPERSTDAREATRETTREGPGERSSNIPPPRNSTRRPLAPAVADTASSGVLALPHAGNAAGEAFNPARAKQMEPHPVRYQGLEQLPIDQGAEYPTRGHLITGEILQQDATAKDTGTEDADLAFQAFQLSVHEDSSRAESTLEDAPEALEVTPNATAASIPAATHSLLHRVADWRVILRFHRADLYLGVAVCVAALALLWPAATLQRRPSLGLWDRTLIALGIAEAADPAVVHLQGDPAIKVWVDPHSALYYCPGEDQYGKTTDGRYSTQHEAQLDHFEPAVRDACE